MIFTKPSPAFWRGRRGVNLSGYYFLTTSGGDPTGYAADVYTSLPGYSAANIDAIKAAGFDHARLMMNCAPLLAAQSLGDSARVSSLLADLKAVVAAFVARGLPVVFDNHISPSDATWGPAAVLVDKSTSGAKYLTFKAVTAAIATMLRPFAPEIVAQELMNEPPAEASLPGINAVWSATLAQDLWQAARSVDTRRTIIVPGTEVGSPDAVNGSAVDPLTSLIGLTASQFDTNTLFTWHYYSPTSLSHCGYNDPSLPYLKYLDGIGWPLNINGVQDTVSRDAVIATATANINADGALSAGQKTTLIGQMTTAVNNLYANLDVVWHLNPYTGKLRMSPRWCRAQGVDASQIYVGEFGIHRSTRGATQAGRDNWMAMVRNALEGQDMRWAVFAWDGPSFANGFNIGDGSTVPLSTRQALGLA